MYNQINKIRQLISESRLSSYETAYARSISQDSIVLYKWNCALSESFYPLLQTIEVAFRNSVHTAIASKFNDPNWLLQLRFLQGKEKEVVSKVIDDLKIKHGPKFVLGHLIAELSFGFWTALLDKRYEQLIWPKIIKASFPGMLNKIRNIAVVRHRFHLIRKFRNRIFHYECIWHWHNLSEMHKQIIEAITWIEPALLKLIDLDRFQDVYTNGLKNIKHADNT